MLGVVVVLHLVGGGGGCVTFAFNVGVGVLVAFIVVFMIKVL